MQWKSSSVPTPSASARSPRRRPPGSPPRSARRSCSAWPPGPRPCRPSLSSPGWSPPATSTCPRRRPSPSTSTSASPRATRRATTRSSADRHGADGPRPCPRARARRLRRRPAGRLPGLRGRHPGRRRRRHPVPRCRLQRPHRLQRADVLAVVADQDQDPCRADAGGQRPLLRLDRRRAAALPHPGARHDHGRAQRDPRRHRHRARPTPSPRSSRARSRRCTRGRCCSCTSTRRSSSTRRPPQSSASIDYYKATYANLPDVAAAGRLTMLISAERILFPDADAPVAGHLEIDGDRFVAAAPGPGAPAGGRARRPASSCPATSTCTATAAAGRPSSPRIADEARRVLATHRRHGVTTMVASLVTGTDRQP